MYFLKRSITWKGNISHSLLVVFLSPLHTVAHTRTGASASGGPSLLFFIKFSPLDKEPDGRDQLMKLLTEKVSRFCSDLLFDH